MLTMKKNKIKKSLVLASCLCAFALTGGLIAGATGSADAEVSTETFSMVEGASIRVSTDQTNPQNGIRFTAEISKAEFDSWKEGKTVEAGTFVMPYSYWANGAINEYNCFDPDEAKYWWEGNGTEKGDKKTIIHIPASVTSEAKVSRTGSGEMVYQVNGSVVNIKDANLARKYIGVSYLKVDDEYYFAETTPATFSRSTVSVAQNILLANDTQYASVANSYLNQYLTANGGSKEVTLSTKVYVNYSEGYQEYDGVSIDDETIVLDSADDFAKLYGTAPDASLMAGYTLVLNGNGNVNSTPVRVDGDTNALKFYYDKNVENTVLFDGSLGETEAEVLQANKISQITNGSSATTSRAGFQFSSDWGYHGGNSIWFDDYYGDNNGDLSFIYYSEAVVFPTETNKISFMIRSNEEVAETSNFPTQIYIKDKDGNQVWGAFQLPENLGLGEVAQVTANFKKSFSSVQELAFSCNESLTSVKINDNFLPQYVGEWPVAGSGLVHAGEDNPYYIDYIQAEFDAVVDELDNIEIFNGEQTSTAMNVLDGVVSTVYSDKEFASKVSASYVELPGTESAPLTISEGVLTIPVEQEETYKVTVSYGTTQRSFYVLGYYKYAFASFDVPDATDDYYEATGNDGTLSTNHAINGTTSYYINNGTDNFVNLYGDLGATGAKTWFSGNQGGDIAVACNTLTMWIYTDTAKTLSTAGKTDDIRLSLKGNGTWAWGAGGTMTNNVNFAGQQLEAGWNYVEIAIPTISIKVPNNTTEPISVDGAIGFYQIIFWTRQGGVNSSLYGTYIDRVAFKGATTYTLG